MMTNIQDIMNRKKIEPPTIKTLDKKTQVIYNWCGAYDMGDGSILLGCDEDHIETIIWHETIHMILFEQFYLEACRLWDNIADEIQYHLFDICTQDKPYVMTQPVFQAKPITDSEQKWLNGKINIEKSEKTGYKNDGRGARKVPIRTHEEIIKNMVERCNER